MHLKNFYSLVSNNNLKMFVNLYDDTELHSSASHSDV